MLRRIFQTESSAGNFTRWNFQLERNCPEQILREEGYFKWEELSPEESPVRVGYFSWGGSQIKKKKSYQVKVRSKIKTQNEHKLIRI